MLELRNWYEAVLSLLLFGNAMLLGLGSIGAILLERFAKADHYEWDCVTRFMSVRRPLTYGTLGVLMIHLMAGYHVAWSLLGTVVYLATAHIVIPRMRRDEQLVDQEGDPVS